MGLLVLLLAFAVPALCVGQVTGNNCSATSNQIWTWYQTNGTLVSGNGACLTSSTWPAQDGTTLVMAACTGGPSQAFDYIDSNATLMARYDRIKCVNLAGYGVNPGTPVWLYGCVPPNYTCLGNCDWHPTPVAHLRNLESGLCLDDGGPPMPHTCANGSVASVFPYCNASLSIEERAEDIVSRLTREAKEAFFVLPLPVSSPALVNRRCSERCLCPVECNMTTTCPCRIAALALQRFFGTSPPFTAFRL